MRFDQYKLRFTLPVVCHAFLAVWLKLHGVCSIFNKEGGSNTTPLLNPPVSASRELVHESPAGKKELSTINMAPKMRPISRRLWQVC